jgi:hypothetical protein
MEGYKKLSIHPSPLTEQNGQLKCLTLTKEPMHLSLFRGGSQSTYKQGSVGGSGKQKLNVRVLVSCSEQVINFPEINVAIELTAKVDIIVVVPC